ncbi:hypothetical protein COCCADRAFT_9072 [Bipolaris zeicola 26-R-13]|uniref:Uncharacterized protein n=1 Tax=Cochliobolus carbonum (strain 26-R-13) TaxID=930089 RepID=W6XTB5_COCC2|nr:uncharacterized protein COCCADRAFT_9072 [Bipolaris zeicola 26-R-13]EUC28585.1 hypothetical protein COCCADRAFT_9072 [Bipolaris zeicola 26-R-13]
MAATIRSNEDLAARVANLEALIQAQDANAHSSSADTILPLGRAKGMLLTKETDHVRFIPSAASEDRENSPYDPHQALRRLTLVPRLFHILHDPTFNKQYEVFERAPESMSLSWIALLNAIVGTSVMALGPSSGLLNDLSRKELVTD